MTLHYVRNGKWRQVSNFDKNGEKTVFSKLDWPQLKVYLKHAAFMAWISA